MVDDVAPARRRTALITGAAQGLGAAIAAALHRRGMNVVVADIQVGRAHETAAALDRHERTAFAAELDVRSRANFEAVFASARARYGSVDVLVNNAGLTAMGSFTEITDEQWDEVLAVNLRSAWIGCQLAVGPMKQQRWGRIVNITSLAGQLGSRLAGAHYSVSKAGLIGLTKVVAREYAAFGITVNAIAPAVVRAPVMAQLPKEGLQRLIDGIPVGRMGEAEEVGEAAAFLASEDAGYITGSTLDINGGQYMR